jgi:hypothetical protein
LVIWFYSTAISQSDRAVELVVAELADRLTSFIQQPFQPEIIQKRCINPK